MKIELFFHKNYDVQIHMPQVSEISLLPTPHDNFCTLPILLEETAHTINLLRSGKYTITVPASSRKSETEDNIIQ